MPQYHAMAALKSQSSNTSSDQDTNIYNNQKYGIKIKYPHNWSSVENVGNISNHSIVVNLYTYGYSNISAYTQNVNLVIGQLSNNKTSLQNYTKAGIALLAHQFNNFTLDQVNKTTLSGSPASEIIYTLNDGQTSVKQMQVWTLKDGKDYILTYSAAPSSRFDISNAKKIFDSFVISK
ncbi:MAG TPA: PsbP-related protein [Nitrososphaeraceae archaeon]|jgi:serine/threonine-protein kinase